MRYLQVMIGCIWGEDAYMEETVSTLRFASRVKTLTTDISINERNDPTLLLRKYERQIAELKQVREAHRSATQLCSF